MSDIATDNYKKNVTAAITRWSGKVKPLAEQIVKVDDEIAKIEAVKEPSDDEKKRLEECKKTYKSLRDKIEKANLELKLDLMALDPPTRSKDNESDLKALPAFIQKVIKDKALPLGKNVTLKPDIDFDLKAVKLKKLELIVTWRF